MVVFGFIMESSGGMLNYPMLYLEHLSESDLELMARATGRRPDAATLRTQLRSAPETIDLLLGAPELYDAVFGDLDTPLASAVSPFLVFGMLVNRVAADLREASYVLEWSAPKQRLPVFDVVSLRQIIDDPARRYFLVELLTSFTKVTSGSTWVRTRKGYRRRRYSELDPVRLAEMVDLLPASQRPGGYRRLGDVALFLSGVFPDHTATNPVEPRHRENIVRSAGIPESAALDQRNALGFHEALGAGWYRRAVDAAAAAVGAGPSFLLDVADHFRETRRVLNYLADRYLFRLGPGLMRPAG